MKSSSFFIFGAGDLKIEHVKEISKRLNVKRDEVISMNRRLAGKEQSLNAQIGEDGDEWQDWVVDKEMDQELNFAQKEELNQRKDILKESINTISSLIIFSDKAHFIAKVFCFLLSKNE